MSTVSLPVNRPVSRALVVGSAPGRTQAVQILQRLYSFECVEADDPYSAMLELSRRKTVYNALILSLAGMYREELSVIATVKRRFPHIEVWLTHTDGRAGALAEAMRLGADGLLGDDGLHRIAPPLVTAMRPAAEFVPSAVDVTEPPAVGAPELDEPFISEPVLSAEELRALLQEQPSLPSGSQSDEQRS